jgi:hypothetical protein
MNHYLSSVYTGDKTLHVVAIASSGDLKRCGKFLLKSRRSAKSLDSNRLCKRTFRNHTNVNLKWYLHSGEYRSKKAKKKLFLKMDKLRAIIAVV